MGMIIEAVVAPVVAVIDACVASVVAIVKAFEIK